MKEFSLDPNHSGLLFASLAALCIGTVLGAIAAGSIFSSLSIPAPFLPVAAAAIGSGLALVAVTEQLSKRYWRSGKLLRVSDEGMWLLVHSNPVLEIDFNREVLLTTWRFTINRTRGFVPRGWVCTALHIEQEETSLALYAFAKHFDHNLQSDAMTFKELRNPNAFLGTSGERPDVDPEELTDLIKHERQRWVYGFEMSIQDFATLTRCVRQLPSPDQA